MKLTWDGCLKFRHCWIAYATLLPVTEFLCFSPFIQDYETTIKKLSFKTQ